MEQETEGMHQRWSEPHALTWDLGSTEEDWEGGVWISMFFLFPATRGSVSCLSHSAACPLSRSLGPKVDSHKTLLAWQIVLGYRVGSMQLDQGDGVDKVGEIRVLVCLSRRGCRWADGIALTDRQQASAADAGVWVRERNTCIVAERLLALFVSRSFSRQ